MLEEKTETAIRKGLDFLMTSPSFVDRAGNAKRNFDEELRGNDSEGFRYNMIIEKYFEITNGLWKEYSSVD